MKTGPTVLSDEELFLQWKGGHVPAFQLLYGRYFRKLVWFVTGFGLEKAPAEDLIQDFFLHWWEKADLYKVSAGQISTWLYVSIGNRARNALRQHQNHRQILEGNVLPFLARTETGNDVKMEVLERRELVRHLVDSLSGKEKNLYLLRFEEEKTIPEIARILELPEGSVKSGLFYLIQKVGKALKKNTYDAES